MSTLSVVIPAFNASSFLREAILSVLNQEHCSELTSTEIVVVDDGSSDDTVSIASEFDSVLVLKQQHRGAAAARNLGLEHATGQYIAFLDADDIWISDKVQTQVQRLSSNRNLDAVFGLVDEFINSADIKEERLLAARALKLRTPGFLPGSMMIRASFIEEVGPFDSTVRAGEFIDWLSRAKLAGMKFEMLYKTVLLRRVHANSLMMKSPESVADYTSILKSHLDRLRLKKSLADPPPEDTET